MISEVIKEAMTLRNVKSKELAEHIGVTRSSMSLFLNNKRAIGLEKIEAMLQYLRIKLEIEK